NVSNRRPPRIADRHSTWLQNPGEQPVGAAVEVTSGKDLIARRKQTRDRSDRSHAAREGKSVFGVFNLGKLTLEHCSSRIAASRVIIRTEFRRGLLFERCGLVDRCDDWAI